MTNYISKKYKKENNIRCSICNRIISNERHIRCIKCPNFIQCLQCTTTFQENENHLIEHSFIIIEPRPYPIFCQNWDAHDELLLLSGIKLFGIGNWNEIAIYMKTKTALDIETHYTAIYINSPNAPLPIPEVLPQVQKPPLPPYDTRPSDSCPSEGHEKHMQEKNKKEKTYPAEYNGYMPHRHEFEIDFNNDAENLIAKIEFKDGEETKQSFETKISFLVAYNNILAERKFRTKVIEDWDIHHKPVKPSKDKDLDTRFLGGFSSEEKAVDARIISIAPYLGIEKTQLLTSLLHQKIKFLKKIHQRQQWKQYGIRSLDEGILFSNLQNCIKDGKNPTICDVESWNEFIAKYNRNTEKIISKNKECLNNQELQLCTKEKIDPQLYLSLKNLLIREGSFRPLRKQDAIAMDPNYTSSLSKVYDLLVSLGMLRAY